MPGNGVNGAKTADVACSVNLAALRKIIFSASSQGREKRRQAQDMAAPAFLAKIVNWLRAGYPDGVPERDYVPLFAVLRTQLTGDEMTLIAQELAFSSAPDSAEAIKSAIGVVTRTPVNDADVARVRSRLAAGWPLAAPDTD